jgi:hypothetical protein
MGGVASLVRLPVEGVFFAFAVLTPPAAPLDHDQHQERKLPAAREAQGGPAQTQARR